MTNRRYTIAVLCAACALAGALGGQARAQDDQLPDAQQLIKKYIDAMGGAEALEKTRTLKATGTLEGAIAGTFETYFGKGHFYRNMSLDQVGDYEQGHNGERAWEKNPFPSVGNREFQDAEKDDFIRRMDHRDMLTWGEGFPGEIETKAKDVSVRGVPCYEIQFQPESGNAVSRYFSMESGLLIKIALILETPTGPVAFDIFLDDYKDLEGAKMAMKVTQENQGTPITFNYEEVSVLDEFPADKAKLPAEFDQ